ncbi:hypothetical protein [Spirobacillus cienkowskii]|uniref:hypothetical protein n=1 Tax=Spirobacillus cienkowskii TaxID=495820 RepID=UPI0030CCF084
MKKNIFFSILAFFISLAVLIVISIINGIIINEKYPVFLPDLILNFDYWDSGSVYATGTWIIENLENDKPAIPDQISKIICNRKSQFCEIVTASIYKQLLNVDNEKMSIVKWDDTELIYGSSYLCVRYVYSINRLTEKVTGSRIKRKDIQDSMCNIVEEKTLNLKLVNGSELIREARKNHSLSNFSMLLYPALIFIFLLYLIWKKIIFNKIKL